MPQQELERLKAVDRFLKLKISKEEELQEIVRLSAKVCDTPSAMITLIGKCTQYIKFRQAFEYDFVDRANTFCTHVIAQDHIMIVPDALLDQRFQNNPAVVDGPCIRFYAGVPLTTFDGHHVGTLCVIDYTPGSLNENQQEMLTALGKQVIQLMEFEETLHILKKQYLESQRATIEIKAFFESSIDMHLLLGKNFEVLNFNKSGEVFAFKQYGYRIAKGMKMSDYLPTQELRICYEYYRTALAGTSVFDERKITFHGKDYWWIVKFDPALSENGEIIGVSLNVVDITTRVEHEQKVQLQTKQLQEIAFIQSHEFRRPVASMLGLMELINMDGRMADMEEWEMMERAVKELDHKIHDVVSKIN